MTSRRVMVALGCNLGDCVATLKAVCRDIAALPLANHFRASPVYRSAAIGGAGEQPDYFNAVVAFESTQATITLWHALERIERAHGRVRTRERNAARVIDIDLLLVGNATLATPSLTLPHPRLTERAFVLLPLLDLDPDATIPNLGRADAFLDRVRAQRIERVAQCELWT
jgi:2-amino-4-hydroxy-6-hydroxymethyldihydropteridine diphosphokinase